MFRFDFRLELTVILMNEELFIPASELNEETASKISTENSKEWIDFEMV